MLVGPATARKQALAWLPTADAKVVVSGVIGQLEATGRPSSSGDIGSVERVTVGRHVVDTKHNKVATAQFAVDRKIEQSQIARAALQ